MKYERFCFDPFYYFHSNNPKQELTFGRRSEDAFPLLFCRNEIKWKTPKLCFNVLKSWHIDSNELKQGDECFVAI